MIPRRYRARLALKIVLLLLVAWMCLLGISHLQSWHEDDVVEDRQQDGRALNAAFVDRGKIEDPRRIIEEKSIDKLWREPGEHPEGILPPPRDPDEPGENGQGYKVENPSERVQALLDKGFKDNAFNQYVSDLMSIHRSLPDPRDQWCKVPGRFATELPSTSVVICFHNEAWSTLLRTVHSVMDRSPAKLLDQIILVDDASTMDHLKTRLTDYVKIYKKLKIVRLKDRQGLIRARIEGFRVSSSPTVTFLDSHCECATGWLEPLLDRIAGNNTRVVCPVIDVIDDDTLKFNFQGVDGINVGGFDWNLQFNWHGVPARERERHSHAAEALASPTMAGGLFTIDSNFFKKLGTYDSGFDIWGGENLELSFKTWMCGGSLEIIPCSHVGHIFRKRSPYKWRSGVNVLRKNTVRLAEVWLDEYKEYYYERIGHNLGDYGNVADRKQLRSDLKCESFKWYLTNIYPELFVPGDAVASGEIRNGGSTYCIDSAVKSADNHKPVGLWPCHNQGGNQFWLLSKAGEIRRDESCLDFSDDKDAVFVYPCHGSGGNQLWKYNHQEESLMHVSSSKCMTLAENNDKVMMNKCDKILPKQRWKFGVLKSLKP